MKLGTCVSKPQGISDTLPWSYRLRHVETLCISIFHTSEYVCTICNETAQKTRGSFNYRFVKVAYHLTM